MGVCLMGSAGLFLSIYYYSVNRRLTNPKLIPDLLTQLKRVASTSTVRNPYKSPECGIIWSPI